MLTYQSAYTGLTAAARSERQTPAPILPASLAASLTPQENIVMQALLGGQDLSAIAWRLARDIRTVSSHKQRAMRKLRLHSNAELYALASLLDPRLPADRHARLQRLSHREWQVLDALLNGQGVTDIAHQQRRSVKTISIQKRQLMKKLEVASEIGLFVLLPQRAQALLNSRG
jgi:DNA-binding NarL/FixJ family response regulator